jgi:uncharacterized protein YoaH (UPF0181 family)
MASLRLGGKQREVRFTWKAIKQLNREHGINVLRLDEDAVTNPEVISLVIWAGLIHEDPELTVEQIDEWMDIGLLPAVGEAISAAVQESASRPTSPVKPANSTGPKPHTSEPLTVQVGNRTKSKRSGKARRVS